MPKHQLWCNFRRNAYSYLCYYATENGAKAMFWLPWGRRNNDHCFHTHTHTHNHNFLQLHFNLLQSTVIATPSLFYIMISKFITTSPLLTTAHQTQSWQYLHQLCAKLCNWPKDFGLLQRLLSHKSDNITTYYICLFFWKAAYGTKN